MSIYDKNGFDATASGFNHGDAPVLLLFGPVVAFLLMLLLILFWEIKNKTEKQIK